MTCGYDCAFCLNRFWWSLLVGVDWWDAVGCTQSAAEDGIGIISGAHKFFDFNAA